MLRSHLSPLARIRAFLDDAVRPIFGEWSIGQLALISILAGLCEEALFRGAIQGILSEAIGRLPALVLASLLFGAAHYITVGYAVLAALIGAYLGALWLATDNLLVPILVHVLYDLIALIYFLRIAK
jgi:hypothetical protein